MREYGDQLRRHLVVCIFKVYTDHTHLPPSISYRIMSIDVGSTYGDDGIESLIIYAYMYTMDYTIYHTNQCVGEY